MECNENREKFEPFVGEFVDDARKDIGNSTAEKLRIKLEIFREKIKRRKNDNLSH